jgi:YVTN family beta-propeller protein
MHLIQRPAYLLLFALSLSVVAYASMAPPQKFVYAANIWGDSIAVIDPATLTVVFDIPVPSPYGIALSPVAERMYVTNWYESSVTVLNSQSGEMLATIPVGNTPEAIAVTPNGESVYVGNVASSDVSVIDAMTNAVVATIPTAYFPYGIAVSPDGQEVYIATTSGNDTAVLVLDTSTNTVVDSIPLSNTAINASFTPNGKQVYVSTSTTEIAVIDTQSRSVDHSISLSCKECYPPENVVFSPTGNRAYASLDFGRLMTINSADYKLQGLTRYPYNPYFSIVSEAISYDCSDPSKESEWRVYVGSSGEDSNLPASVSVIEPEKSKLLKQVEIGNVSGGVQAIAVTPCSALPKPAP